MERVALPIQEAIRDCLFDLLDRGTAVSKLKEGPDPDEIGAVCGYRSDDGTLRVLISADKKLVGIVGAALALVPKAVLEEALRKGEIPENLYENFFEVANVLTGLLNRANEFHMALTDRSQDLESVTDEMRKGLDAPRKRRDFAITVEGYGDGLLSLTTV